MLMLVDEDGRQKLEPGKYRLTQAAAPPVHAGWRWSTTACE